MYKLRQIFPLNEELNTIYNKLGILEINPDSDKIFEDFPTMRKIPKDNGKVRDIFVSTPADNARQLLVYKYLYREYNNLINRNVVSYQEGMSTIKIVHKIMKELRHIKITTGNINMKIIVMDLSDYFNSTPVELIMASKDKYLQTLKTDKPEYDYYLNEFFKIDRYWYKGELHYKKPSLQVGSAISAFFANLVLKDFDDYVSNNDYIFLYRRYADDLIIAVMEEDIEHILQEIQTMIESLRLKINNSKTKIYDQSMFEWVGIQVNNLQTTTLSKKHWARRKHNIKSICKKYKIKMSKCKKDIEKKDKIFKDMVKAINRWLYYMDDNMSNATYIFKVSYKENQDIYEFNGYIKDTMRAAYTGKYNKLNPVKVSNEKLREAGYLDLALMHKLYRDNKYMFHAVLKKHTHIQYEIPNLNSPGLTEDTSTHLLQWD